MKNKFFLFILVFFLSGSLTFAQEAPVETRRLKRKLPKRRIRLTNPGPKRPKPKREPRERLSKPLCWTFRF